MVPGSIPSIDLDTHGGDRNCSEQTGYPVSQGSAPGDQGALTSIVGLRSQIFFYKTQPKSEYFPFCFVFQKKKKNYFYRVFPRKTGGYRNPSQNQPP